MLWFPVVEAQHITCGGNITFKPIKHTVHISVTLCGGVYLCKICGAIGSNEIINHCKACKRLRHIRKNRKGWLPQLAIYESTFNGKCNRGKDTKSNISNARAYAHRYEYPESESYDDNIEVPEEEQVPEGASESGSD